MTTMFLAQLLIAAVLLPPILHTFAKDKHATRAVPLLILVAFFFLFLTTLAYEMSAPLFFLWITAIFIFFGNIVRFYRFFLHLTFDSTAFSYVVAVIQLLLLTAVVAVCVVFRPAPYVSTLNKTVPTITRYEFTRVSENQFMPREHFSQTVNVLLTLVEPQNKSENAPMLVYLPDIFASTADCLHTAAALAEEGFSVVLADFNLKNSVFSQSVFGLPQIRPFAFRMLDYFSIKSFTVQKSAYYDEKARELDLLHRLLTSSSFLSEYNNRFYLIAEGGIKSLAQNAKEQYSEQWGVCFIHTAQNPIPDYISGYGNLAALHPFEAFLRGNKRDSDGNQARLIGHFAAEALHDAN